nr:MAG TPA: dystroglycan [Caudoviricetes sp.]
MFSDTGNGSRFFCLNAKQIVVMKNQISGTESFVPSFRSTQNVNTLQERYFRSMTDCEVKTDSDRYYMAAIFSACIGFVFPPCLLVAAYCVYKAKKGGKS